MSNRLRDEILTDVKRRFQDKQPIHQSETEFCSYLMELNQTLKQQKHLAENEQFGDLIKSSSPEGILFQTALGLFALGRKEAIYDILPHLHPNKRGAYNAARIACALLPLPPQFYREGQKFEHLKGWLETNFNQLEWDNAKKAYFLNCADGKPNL